MPYVRKWYDTCPQIWSKWESNGRHFVIQDLEPKDYELANDYFIKHFIQDEKLTTSLDVSSDPVSVRGMRHFWDVQFAKNVSLGCYCEINGVRELIAWNCCQVECADDVHEEDEKIEGWATINVIKGLHYVNAKVDVFKKYNVDKYLGGSGLFVRREFRGEHLGARLLNAREPLCRHLGIKLTSTIFTGIPSQKCAARCGFETIAEVTLGELGRNGMGFKEDDESVLKLMTLYYG